MKHYIYTNDNCIGCNHCISCCPIPGANIAEKKNNKNHIRVNMSKCILCGQCLSVCKHDARYYVDDTDAFFQDLNNGESLSVVIDPSFFINYPNIANGVLGYLRSIGVKKIYNASFGADISTWAHIEYFLNDANQGGIIATCPTIVNFIEKYEPSIIPALIPIYSPIFCLAVYVRKYLNDSNKLVFLSPCISNFPEIEDEATHNLISYNVTFEHFFKKLKDIDFNQYYSESDIADFDLGALYPFPGGMKENLEHFIGYEKTIISKSPVLYSRSELGSLKSIAEHNCTKGVFFELLNCNNGCCSGPCIDKTSFSIEKIVEQHQCIRFNILQNGKSKEYDRTLPRTTRLDLFRSNFKDLDLQDFHREFHSKYLKPFTVPKEIINEVFVRMHKTSEESRHIDCHACGYNSCHQMAEAVANGYNNIENCVQYEKEENYKLFTYDQLTGLPNKYLFIKDLSDVLAAPNSSDFAVMQINIKNFIFINQQVGFIKGNDILAEFAAKARELFDETKNEKIYLLNGNNFYVISKKERINDLFYKLNHLELLTLKQFQIADISNLSIRAALYNITGSEPNTDTVIDRISTTYFTVRSLHNKDFLVYDQDIAKQVSQTISISQHIQQALLNNSLYVVYQPKVNQLTNKLVGAEALIRWNHNGTVVPPDKFIPVCESTGFIKRLDFFMLNQICKKLDEWIKKGIELVPISVNFSKQHFTHQEVAERICNIIDFWKIPHNLIEVEFTETSIAEMKEILKNTIDILKDKGIPVSIDDFGSGYSSLSLLQDLDFDVLKLDKSFIKTVVVNKRARTVIANVINMAKELNMSVIAEGVETKEELSILKKLKCNVIQGFIFDKPLSVEDFEQRLINKQY
ncbi:MAG: EAL domain-containing protein [Spirochaetaceae bacterium]|nr:EAL domain-containing protein [Spirochaetaceae bacterium]